MTVEARLPLPFEILTLAVVWLASSLLFLASRFCFETGEETSRDERGQVGR
jgi:hypothetical protein